MSRATRSCDRRRSPSARSPSGFITWLVIAVGGSEAHPAVISHLTVSVLIPSWKRPAALLRCLRALARQTRPPDEVFVIWQADDAATAEAVEAARDELPATLRLLHSPTS